MPVTAPEDGWPVVKVGFYCPVDRAHVLGAVGRQLQPVPGSPAGRETVSEGNGLRIERGPSGETKLVGACVKCGNEGDPFNGEMRWERVRKLLDHVEQTDSGVVWFPMPRS